MNVNVVAPEPVAALGPADTARVEQAVLRRRSDVARLTLALRRLETRAAQIEQDLASRRAEAGASPREALDAVDAMLGDTAARQADELDTARREARAVVSAARAGAEALLRSVGIDPADADADADADDNDADGAEPARRVPRSAAALWAEVRGGADVSTTTPVDRLRSPRTAVSSEPVAGDADADDGAGRPAPGDAGLLARQGANGEAARVYELFWGGVPAERSVRDRLRRRPERDL